MTKPTDYETLAAQATVDILTRQRAEDDRVINDLRTEVRALREQMSTMHPSVVHDCCVAVEQVRKLADTIESEIAPFTKPGDRTVADRIRAALVVKP